MRIILTLLFLAFCCRCLAQYPASFDKIVISYAKGHNSWGAPGAYGNGELFELLPSKAGFYKINTYQTIEFTAGDDGDTFSEDTTDVSLNRVKVPKSRIDSLYAQFAITKSNFTPEFIRPFLKTPTKSGILIISKKIDEHYKFQDIDRKEMLDHINRIRRFDKIDSFINLKQPDPHIYTAMSDVWNDVRISFIRQNDTTVFQADFLQLLGQPFEELKINHQLTLKPYVNLEMNQLLEEILPIGSETRERVGINNLTEAYTEWYIDKVLQ